VPREPAKRSSDGSVLPGATFAGPPPAVSGLAVADGSFTSAFGLGPLMTPASWKSTPSVVQAIRSAV
jgi:hypothetical protein